MWGRFSIMKNSKAGDPVAPTIQQTYRFSYVQCMPGSNSSVLNKIHVKWRDFAIFIITGWSDIKQHLRHVFTHEKKPIRKTVSYLNYNFLIV